MKRGFTLLEILLTVVLLVTGTVALLQVVSSGISAGGADESGLIAVNLAQDKIEEKRAADFSSIVNEAKLAVSGYPAFSREVVVTTPRTGLKQVSVNVYWTAKSVESTAGLVTYVSDV